MEGRARGRAERGAWQWGRAERGAWQWGRTGRRQAKGQSRAGGQNMVKGKGQGADQGRAGQGWGMGIAGWGMEGVVAASVTAVEQRQERG